MRYYEITLTPKGSTTPFRTWTSHPNGIFDPGALNIMFDMPILPYGTPSGGQSITVEGISLQDLSQSQQFAEMTLTLKAGMKAPGLPLINPTQAGTVLSGLVFQSFGNWEGTEMTVDFVMLPSIYTNDNPGNFMLIWPKGERLSDAILHCLQVPYPDKTIKVNISPDYVNSYDIFHQAGTLEDLSMFIGDFTDKTFKDRVEISILGDNVSVIDSTFKPSPIQLNFLDFVGQPTWIEPNVIQIKTVLRADVSIGSIVRMPEGLQNAPGVITATGASLPSSIKYKSTFQNTFTVIEVRQIGNFRSPDASNWCTVLNCVTN